MSLMKGIVNAEEKNVLLIVASFAHVGRCCALLLRKNKEEDLTE